MMDYAITLMMSSGTEDNASARAKMMIELGMQLLEIQDILYSKLEGQYDQKRKKGFYQGIGDNKKIRFSQVRM